MHLSSKFRIDLRRLILLLAVAAALLTLASSFHASYRVQRDLLIRQNLEANRVYAAKLAESTEGMLEAAHQQLAYSASRLAPLLEEPLQLALEADRLRQQTDSFNSTFIIRADRTLLAVSPHTLAKTGSTVDSLGALEALARREPLVSHPFVSGGGRLLIAISHPIHAADGHYLGYVGGAIYLHETSVLGSLLADPLQRDGAYLLYLVDRHGQILHHRDPQRVGEMLPPGPALEALGRGESGSLQHGETLTGYAPVPSTGWGIVAQRPREAIRAELHELMLGTLRTAIPLSLLTLLGLWWVSRLIARPLWQLASSAHHLDSQTAGEQIRQVRAWYYEAGQLKQALMGGLSQLNLRLGARPVESNADPLTGLLNRRGMLLALEQWQLGGHPYAVIAIDVDHFKEVNDRFGHDVGDQLLRHLAQLMQQIARQADVLCRYGGEEFIMLLPRTTLVDACGVAERLRQCVADSPSPDGTTVTISLGVAHCADSRNGADTVLKKADQALFAAKNQGRNRVVIASAT